ncbi:MAG: hypothetical protein GX410_05775 [Elusimicrobia bacterium]|nr:hypothetical protein [Elusimicrobiota bacterium]
MTRDIRVIMRDLDRYCKSIADENLEEQSQEELKRNATAHPHHVWMARHMLEHFPEFKSLLEIGCRSGENLRLLHSINPDAHLMGIEKNYALAAHGNACFKEADIPITIAAGDPLVLD